MQNSSLMYEILYDKIDNLSYYENIQDIIYLTLSLLSCQRDEEEAWELFLKYKDYKDIFNRIFQINLKLLEANFNNNKKTIASYDCMYYGGLLIYLSNRLNEEEGYNFLYIISKNTLKVNSSRSRLGEFMELPFIFIEDEKNLRNFNFLDLVIIQEGFFTKTYFPEKTIRVMQPHGLDIASNSTIAEFGGGTFAKYILAPMKEEHTDKNRYIDMFPRRMIEHSSDSVCVVPLGYPKLDQFIDAYQLQLKKNMQKKIILHCSHLDWLSDEAKNDIPKTLQLLLDAFTEHIIVLRPFPLHKDNPIILNALSAVKNNPRVFFSIKSSYIEDYAGADFLVSHRIETAQTFAHATNKPIIYFPIEQDKDSIKEHPLGFLVHTHSQLVQTGKHILENKNTTHERIKQHTSELLNNVGNISNYFIDNLPYMLNNEKHPNWHYYKLYDNEKPIDFKDNYISCLDSALRKNKPLENIARSALEYYPDDNIFYYYLLRGLLYYPANTNSHFFFRWYEAIDIVSKLLNDSYDKVEFIQFCAHQALEKAYILLEHVKEFKKESFEYLSISHMTYEEFIEYTNNSEIKIQTWINLIIANIQHNFEPNQEIDHFFEKHRDRKIIIWGAGAIFDKIKHYIPSDTMFRVVDKKLYNTAKYRLKDKIEVYNTDTIEEFNPDIILITSDKFCQEIKDEITAIAIKNVKVLCLSNIVNNK